MEALPIDILSHDTWLKCVYGSGLRSCKLADQLKCIEFL